MTLDSLPAYVRTVVLRECAIAQVNPRDILVRDRCMAGIRGAVWYHLRRGETPTGRPLSLIRIGQLFGFDHSTVHHAVRKHQRSRAAETPQKDVRQVAYEHQRHEWRTANAVHYPALLPPGDR